MCGKTKDTVYYHLKYIIAAELNSAVNTAKIPGQFLCGTRQLLFCRKAVREADKSVRRSAKKLYRTILIR
jgi:hypothetical protein